MTPLRHTFASVDLGGTKIACALVRAGEDALIDERVPTRSHEGPEAVLERIADLLRAIFERAGARPAAVGMGVPGLVDAERGVAMFLPNLPTHWREVPVAEVLSARIGCPVFLLNDARAATLGEFTFGRGRGVDTMAFFTVGTGIGGGLIIGRKLRLGPMGSAGEIGHQTILPDGPLCGCGNRGCLEALASGPALVAEGVRLLQSGQAPALHEITGGNPASLTPREMARAAEAGDYNVGDAIARWARWLGIGVANVVTTLHPDMVVIGGAVAALGDLLLDPVRATVRQRVGMFPTDAVRIERSLLEDRAGLLGGIALAAQKTGSSPRRGRPAYRLKVN